MHLRLQVGSADRQRRLSLWQRMQLRSELRLRDRRELRVRYG